MKAPEAIVELLARADVDTVFTLASEEIIPLLSEMEDERGDEFRVVHCRHEQGAAAMADGYARFAEGIGVCVVGRGPAIAQTGTSLVAASNYGSDVLYLVPETRRTTANDGKGFGQGTFLATMVGEVDSVRSAEVLLPRLGDAIRRIRAGEGPIAVQVPIDVLDADLPEGTVVPEVGGSGADEQDGRVEPDEAAIEAAVEAYYDADATAPPVILAGRGAVAADAKAAIERLAERTNAYLATTVQAMGYFADHPYSLGFSGDLGSPVANEYLGESGFVLALGCSLNHHTVDKGRILRDDAKVVHVDSEPAPIGRFTAVDVGVVGDAKRAAEAFDAKLEEHGIDRRGEFWTDRARERIAETTPVSDRTFEEVPGTADPRELVAALDDALPDDRLVVADVGHFVGWVFDGLTIDPADDLLWATDFLALGQALPLGTGAALAEEERTTVVFCGDAGLMMILQELETAARSGVPMIVVVMNDEALGAEYHMGKARGFSGSVGKIPAPEFGSLAAELGAEGHTVTSADEVEALAGDLQADLDGPVVVECKVNPEAAHRSMGNISIE